MKENIQPSSSGPSTEVPPAYMKKERGPNGVAGDHPRVLDNALRSVDPNSSTYQFIRAPNHGKEESIQTQTKQNDRQRHNRDSESGTEADDEHLVLGRPASRTRPAKLGKEQDRMPPGASTEARREKQDDERISRRSKSTKEMEAQAAAGFSRSLHVELLRRVSEVVILLGVGYIVHSGDDAGTARIWRKGIYFSSLTLDERAAWPARISRRWLILAEFALETFIFGTLLFLYPIRLLYTLASHNHFERWPRIIVPSSFDPAVLLYPPLLANFVSALLAPSNPGIILPNIVLGISSMLTELIPSFSGLEGSGALHWLLSAIPIHAWQLPRAAEGVHPSYTPSQNLRPETLVLLYPLHRTLTAVLRVLTLRSLLETEVQLLSITLINLLLLATSPQVVILKSLLWVGGLSLFISTSFAFKWLTAFERVPKWRFKRVGKERKETKAKRLMREPLGRLSEILHFNRPVEMDSEDDVARVKRVKPVTLKSDTGPSAGEDEGPVVQNDEKVENSETADTVPPLTDITNGRKHSTSDFAPTSDRPTKPSTHTPSGRKKRSASRSLRPLYNLTLTQATVRAYLYSGHIYASILAIALLGARTYVQRKALGGLEPVGWALAYMFGDLAWFRWKVEWCNLNAWIPLSPVASPSSLTTFGVGEEHWVEALRDSIGHATTRLLISSYLAGVLVLGLSIVLLLARRPDVGVDTRRKVFHFTITAMLLPTIFIDPAFIGFALSLILAIFLLLDVLRGGCVPPVSKVLNGFLAPYVDGRDLRGPVVVSHIFLLVGCAIPLWLSSGSVSRSPSVKEGGWIVEDGWNLPTRDVSMLAGVICVGLGDAAASLIGRRFGKRKWIWPGGKTVEGSVSFAVAVAVSLIAGKTWLRFGAWEQAVGGSDAWMTTVGKSVLAATVASLTEAVLTGGNDNVVVPVVFWLCVKGLRT